MKVGLVCPYDLSKPGGVQAQVLGLAGALSTVGDDVWVVGPGLPDDVRGLDLGGSVSVPGNGSMVPISMRTGIRSKIRSLFADVLHVHEPLMPTVSVAALHAGPPVVATFHAAPQRIGGFFYRAISPFLEKALGSNVALTTAVSRTAAAQLGDLECEIVPNAVNVAEMRRDVPRLEQRVVFLGRDEPRKGLDILLRAWPSVLASHPRAELVVMGAKRDLPDVKWMGRVDDEVKAEILNSAAIYIAPNTGGESFGIVLIEAMAAGAAVVASNLQSFIDVAGDDALYFENGSDSDLAQKVVGLLSSPDDREALAQGGTERVEAFDWPVVAARYRELYQSALS